MRRLDGELVSEQDASKFRMLVDQHRWIFAKTYAAFCPHQYTLKREGWRSGDFKWFVKFIWDNGFWATYGKNRCKYFIDSETGFYYFVTQDDMLEDKSAANDVVFLVNRSHLNEFEFVDESTLFGDDIRVKRLPKEERKKWY